MQSMEIILAGKSAFSSLGEVAGDFSAVKYDTELSSVGSEIAGRAETGALKVPRKRNRKRLGRIISK